MDRLFAEYSTTTSNTLRQLGDTTKLLCEKFKKVSTEINNKDEKISELEKRIVILERAILKHLVNH
jgi:uncharacterized protein Yka (UPF0111/DUF47 family)